jgi:hypothetical protein
LHIGRLNDQSNREQLRCCKFLLLVKFVTIVSRFTFSSFAVKEEVTKDPCIAENKDPKYTTQAMWNGCIKMLCSAWNTNMKLNVPEIPKGIPSEASLTDWVELRILQLQLLLEQRMQRKSKDAYKTET